MSSPAETAKDVLNSAGVGAISGSTGWQIKVGRLVDPPNTIIALFDTGGSNPWPSMLIDFVSIQALIRGEKDRYDTAWAKAKEVKDALLGLPPQDLNTNHWTSVTGIGDIAFLRYDDSNRPLFSVNFRIIIEPQTSALSHRVPL